MAFLTVYITSCLIITHIFMTNANRYAIYNICGSKRIKLIHVILLFDTYVITYHFYVKFAFLFIHV